MREAGELMAPLGPRRAAGGRRTARVVGLVTRKDVDKAVRHGLEHAPVKGFMAREIITVGARRRPADARAPADPRGHRPRCRWSTTASSSASSRARTCCAPSTATRTSTAGSPQATGEASRALPGALRARCCPRRRATRSACSARSREERGVRAHLVGGFVRDMLLGRPNLDVDVVVEGDGVGVRRGGGASGWA